MAVYQVLLMRSKECVCEYTYVCMCVCEREKRRVGRILLKSVSVGSNSHDLWDVKMSTFS